MNFKKYIKYKEYPDFPKAGVNFIDLTPSLLNSQSQKEIIKELIRLYYQNHKEIKEQIDYIISPDARGFIWGGMVASEYGLGFIPVRKPGKLPEKAILNKVDYETEYSITSLCLPQVELENKNVLFVDDVYATGGTYKAVKQLIKENKGNLIGGAVLIDIELDKNTEVKSLAKIKELKRMRNI